MVGFRSYCAVDDRFEKVGAYCDCGVSSGRYRGLFTGGRYHVLEIPRRSMKVHRTTRSGLHLFAPTNIIVIDLKNLFSENHFRIFSFY